MIDLHQFTDLPISILLTLLLLLVAILTHTATDPSSITLAFVGDVMLGRDVATALDGDW